MSGGSFEYLCFKGPEDVLADTTQLEAMLAELTALGISDAAKETKELLGIIEEARTKIDARLKRLHGVFHALEWWYDRDYSEEQFKKALADFREAA